MVEASGGKIAQVTREMRLHDSSVGDEYLEARDAKAGQAPTAAERAEIRELKAESSGSRGSVTSGKSSRLLLGVAPEERVTRCTRRRRGTGSSCVRMVRL